MIRYFKVTVLSILVLFCFTGIQADEIRPSDDIGALKTAIDGAKDGDVIILERGKVYYNQVSIDVNVSLTIKADENTVGTKPIVAPLVKEDGGLDKIMMYVRANLTCINIHFHAGISGALGGDQGLYGINFIEGTGLRFIMQGCWMQDWDQRALQLEAPDMKIYFTDCVWTDDWKVGGPSEGRTIDLRQFGPDSLIIKNCSFVNVADRWIRHVPSSGKIDPLNYAVIDHCTFVNGLNYRPAFDFGHVEQLQFTNNIVYNPGILGTDFMRRPSKNSGAFLMAVPEDYFSTSSSLVPHRLSEVYYDRSEGITVLACHDPDSMDTQITMRQNNLYMDQVIIDKIATNDTLHVQQWMCSQFSNSIIDGLVGAFFSELLPFVNAPAPAVEVVDVYAGYWDQNPNMSMHGTAPDSADLSYGTAVASYTAAAGGFPLGDLNWYPDKKAEWETWITDVEENRPEQPADFELSQNYPNPFNPVTVIGYRIVRTGDVTLEVFNTMGQKVRTLFNGTRTAGSYQLTWNGKDDSGNPLSGGIYFYRLKAGNETMMKKMIMMK